MTKRQNAKEIFDNFCKTKGTSPEEVEAILGLYGSDFDEGEIERRLEEYSETAIQVAANLLIGAAS